MTSTPPVSGLAARLAATLAVALPVILFLATLHPGLGDRRGSGDAIELQSVGRVLGVPHETGYPQYVLLTWAWTRLPWPTDLATRVSLFSVACCVLAAVFFFATARRMSREPWSAVLSTWLVFTMPTLWRYATQTEVYALHFAWVTAVTWAALAWHRRPSRPRLALLLAVFALSFGNHLSMAALLPALAGLVLLRRPSPLGDARAVAAGLAAAVAGAAQYGLLWWRSRRPPAIVLNRFPRDAGVADLFAYATGGRFRERHWLPSGLATLPARLAAAAAEGLRQLGLVTVFLVVVGVVGEWRRDRQWTAFLVGGAATFVLLASMYEIRDWGVYCVPAWILLGLFAAPGLSRLTSGRRGVAALVVVAVLASVGARIVAGGRELGPRPNVTDLEPVLAVAEAPATVLVSAASRRQTRVVDDYYRLAAADPRVDGLRFASVEEALDEGVHLAPGRIYFRQAPFVGRLRARLVGARRAHSADGGTYFVVDGGRPLDHVVVAPRAGDRLRLALRPNLASLIDAGDIEALIVTPAGVPLGLAALPEEPSATGDALRALDADLPAGHSILVVAPAIDPAAWEAIEPLVRARVPVDGRLPGPADPPASLVALWRVGGTGATVLVDIEESTTLPLSSDR